MSDLLNNGNIDGQVGRSFYFGALNYMSANGFVERRKFAAMLAGLGGSIAASRFFGGHEFLANLVPSAWAADAAAVPELARYPQ
ncbi:MAG TPA: hypothetical protein VGG59_05995, partial [Acidobacteriaceae bacterium]